MAIQQQVVIAHLRAALGDAEALTLDRHVDDQGFVVFLEDLRADRHLQRHVGAAGARAITAHAVNAGAALEMLLEAEIDQGVQAIDGFHPDITASTAVAIRIAAAERCPNKCVSPRSGSARIKMTTTASTNGNKTIVGSM